MKWQRATRWAALAAVFAVALLAAWWAFYGRAPAHTYTAPTLIEHEQGAVYVTRHGEKYHRLDCRYIRNGARALSVEQARRRYDPCKVCKP